MCTGKCAFCVGTSLYPLAVISIICNIILFFPGWDVKYLQNGQLTEEVKYMGGLVGGGVMVSLIMIHSNVEIYTNMKSIWTLLCIIVFRILIGIVYNIQYVEIMYNVYQICTLRRINK